MELKQRDLRWEAMLTQEQRGLYDRMYSFGEMFNDMLLRKGSGAYELLTVNHKGPDGEWAQGGLDLPDRLELFDYYEYVDVDVEKLDDSRGYFRPIDQLLVIGEATLGDDAVLLHEMIHLHQAALTDSLYPVYADAVRWTLYRSLRDQIPELDDIITTRLHLLNAGAINEAGGDHDLLFMLKSFDLDLRMGYELGTVYGYGMSEAIRGEETTI